MVGCKKVGEAKEPHVGVTKQAHVAAVNGRIREQDVATLEFQALERSMRDARAEPMRERLQSVLRQGRIPLTCRSTTMKFFLLVSKVQWAYVSSV